MTCDIVYLAWNRERFTRTTLRLLRENTDWGRVRRLVLYDDGSTDGARKLLDQAARDWPVPVRVIHLGCRSPVETMRHYLADDPADLFAKVDNDIAVPPGWLDALLSVMERSPWLELLGMEAGQTVMPPAGWEGRYSYTTCSHIGGVGLMRTSAFQSRPLPVPNGRFGFTEWQYEHQPVRGWIYPDLLAPQLDRMPVQPWWSLSTRYVRQGWQRPWPPYHVKLTRAYDWVTP